MEPPSWFHTCLKNQSYRPNNFLKVKKPLKNLRLGLSSSMEKKLHSCCDYTTHMLKDTCCNIYTPPVRSDCSWPESGRSHTQSSALRALGTDHHRPWQWFDETGQALELDKAVERRSSCAVPQHLQWDPDNVGKAQSYLKFVHRTMIDLTLL